MKIIIKLFFTILILSNITIVKNTFSQSEFKIGMENFRWAKPSGSFVTLEIYLKITNIGNESGKCEDLRGIWLFSTDNQYNYSVKIDDYGVNIWNVLKPGEYENSFLAFTVPKAAGGLTLKFSEERGGAEKFITDSYLNFIKDDADRVFLELNYNLAIEKYNTCITEDPTRKIYYEKKISDCYEFMADRSVEDYNNYLISDKLTESISAYESCLKYNINKQSVNLKIAKSYEMLGDISLNASNTSLALQYYSYSQKYNKSYSVSDKIKNIDNQLQQKKDKEKLQKEQKTRKSDINQLLEPTVGLNFKSGVGFSSNSKNNTSGSSLPFWNIEMDLPIKVYTVNNIDFPFNIFINISAGYSGFIGDSSKMLNFFNLEKSQFNIKKNTNGTVLGNYYVNTGIGFALLSNSVTPMISFSYGGYGVHTNFSVLDASNIEYFENELSKNHFGHGFMAEFAVKFGSTFNIGYTYQNYQIQSSLYFLNNRYESHSVKLGVTSF